mmetsp:Transcript_125619/g.244803  ORF Transcript_125619/g.244803 Transcript_125619/m.244803 type:complete len:144 (+) Transcript_125619:80-511(+)
MVDHRVDLLNAVTEGPSAFSAVSDTYGSAPDYFQTMATNVKAELTAAFQQGVNGNGATLSFVLARDTWVLPEGRLEAVRSLKGCVIQDTKTKDVFWIKKITLLGHGRCTEYHKELFSGGLQCFGESESVEELRARCTHCGLRC